MKTYIKSDSVWEGRNYIVRRILNYFEKLVTDAGCTGFSSNDYEVLNDGSLRLELQWDGGNSSPFSIGYDIADYFGEGVTYVPYWDRDWQYSAAIQVAEFRTR